MSRHMRPALHPQAQLGGGNGMGVSTRKTFLSFIFI